jgi:hypothetical protein
MLHWRSAAARALADEIRRVFKLFDDDETGRISFRNLKRVARELGENMTDEELQEIINKADLDGDGEVNEDEFMRIMTCKTRGPKTHPRIPPLLPASGALHAPRSPHCSLLRVHPLTRTLSRLRLVTLTPTDKHSFKAA